MEGMEGGRNRRGRQWAEGPRQAERFLDISELAAADMASVMGIVKAFKVFRVDADRWDCDQKGGGQASRTVHPTEVPCDSHFDPRSGFGCARHARCFRTNVQVGVAETIKQRMDGVATKVFVRQNLLDPDRLWSFLHVFNAAATNVLKRLCSARSMVYGRDVVFAFKGGNVMRLVLLGTLGKLPAAAMGEWDEVMQIGDMDFEVFIDDATELMVRDATILMLYVIYSFRVYMEREGWAIKSDPDAIIAMAAVVPAITSLITEGYKVHSDDNITVPYARQEGCDLLFVPVRSVLTSQQDRGGKPGWLETGARPDSALNISFNRSLSVGVVHKMGVAPEADIVLLRMKHGLQVVVDNKCSRKATAEVIDVSIPTNNDRMHRIKSQDKRTEWFTLYEFEIGGKRIQIHAPSIENFVLDLHMFMFVLSEFPWYDPKQAKRMKRYFWFCTMLRAQQGAGAVAIEAELASVSRVLQTLVSKPRSVSTSGKTSSLARRTPPWAELLQQTELTRSRASDAGLGTKDWVGFVKEMRATATAVRLSYASLASSLASRRSRATAPAPSVSPQTRTRTQTQTQTQRRAALASAAISASRGLSKARVHAPPSA